MPELSELSPFVRQVLEDNNLVPLRVLRYGPRFVCIHVRNGEQEGMFKMVLPLNERGPHNTPAGYTWTDHDNIAILERRLLKEALFLQYFSQHLGPNGFEPQIQAMSETSPVWSLRTYIDERTMSAWDSNFIFSQRFYTEVEPHQVIDFFRHMHRLSDNLPLPLSDIIAEFVSTLTNPSRFERSVARAKQMPKFKGVAKALEKKFASFEVNYAEYERVVTQYEPYSCHLFVVNDKVSLIDWENVGWGHKLQDLSVLWMRCFDVPEWQAEYERLLEAYGYFEGNGRLYWESEILIQSFANHEYFADGGPIGNSEYDKRATDFFSYQIEKILTTSKYFKVL